MSSGACTYVIVLHRNWTLNVTCKQINLLPDNVKINLSKQSVDQAVFPNEISIPHLYFFLYLHGANYKSI